MKKILINTLLQEILQENYALIDIEQHYNLYLLKGQAVLNTLDWTPFCEDSFEIIDKTQRVLATVLPKYKLMIVGTLQQGLSGTLLAQQKEVLQLLYYLPYHLLVFGSSYSLQENMQLASFNRKLQAFIFPTKDDNMSTKLALKSSTKSLVATTKMKVSYIHSLDTLMKTISKLNDPFKQPSTAVSATQDEWKVYYKKPEGLKINTEYWEDYWFFIYERLNIYYKRVVMNQEAPWTKDSILANYKFTNAIRDLDKLTIFYIQNVLAHIDTDTNIELTTRKKEVVLNTMIYRLFCKLDTWNLFGYLHLDTWDKQWSTAKPLLRKRKQAGEPIFTDAYFVNSLVAINEKGVLTGDKLENAIKLIEYWHDNLDTIYENAIEKPDTMEQQLKYLRTVKCVGGFTAYEYACDWTLCHRYTKNILVPWTDDSYTNVGPGAKAGMDYVFQSKGNLSYLECIIYLRSICGKEMKKRGYNLHLPNGWTDVNLRVIEHCLCELSKYIKIKLNVGKPRIKFTPSTSDVNQLRYCEL